MTDTLDAVVEREVAQAAADFLNAVISAQEDGCVDLLVGFGSDEPDEMGVIICPGPEPAALFAPDCARELAGDIEAIAADNPDCPTARQLPLLATRLRYAAAQADVLALMLRGGQA